MLIKEISIVIPALSEEESLPLLVDGIDNCFSTSNIEYEIIIVDDGSPVKVQSYLTESKKLKIIREPYSKGQSSGILKGVSVAKYDYICTLDGDGQNPPTEIIKMIDELNKNFREYDVIAGYRKNRKDRFFRSFYSRLANIFIKLITKTSSKDLGCSLKIFNKKLIEDIRFTGDVHRILLPLFELRNYKILQVPVEHREREFGETKYGIGRIVAVVIDAILLSLTKGFTKSARYSSGKLSFIFLGLSGALFSFALYQKIYLDAFVHRNPLFLIGITTFFISLQFFTIAIVSFFIENKK